MHRRPRLTVALLAALLLAGCADDAVRPAPDGDTPECASAVGRAPETFLGAGRQPSDVPGAVVWDGDHGRIVLRCGVAPPGVTNAPCIDVNGVDWLLVDDGDPLRLVSAELEPRFELTVPDAYGREQVPGALTDLGSLPGVSIGNLVCR